MAELFQPTPSALNSLLTTQKTILITGGSSGIGLATARLLSQLSPPNKPHNLIILDLQPPPPTFTHPPQHFHFHKCSITSWFSQRAGFAAGHAKFSRIDAVFVNAGIVEYKDQFFNFDVDESGELAEPDRRVLNIDMDGAADTTKLAIHYLRKNGKDGGAIVMTASLAGYLASAGAPLYSASKHGVVGLMRALKQECAKINIAVSVVAPAITITPMITSPESNQSTEERAKEMAAHGVPLNKPESVALAACWLINEGMARSGAGIFVQSDRFVDLERGLVKTRAQWMTKEMLDLFRSGRTAPLFTRLETEKESKL